MQKNKLYFLYALLGIGLTVEGSNLQNLFYGFMATFRSDWLPIFNHLAAIGLAAFFLGSIVYNGVFDNKRTSWVLAILTMTVSLYVYREIAPFSLSNIDLTHKHGVVLLLSVVLPYFVAFYTHLVDKEFKANRTPSQPKVVKSEFEKFDDSLNNLEQMHTKTTSVINRIAQMGTSKEPQRINEVVKELAKTVVTPVVTPVTQTVTSNQAPSETIVKDVTEVDIMDVLQEAFGEKK